MRKKFIAGNWKMNKTYQESKTLTTEIIKNLKKDLLTKVDVVICPPFTSLSRINKILKKSRIFLGAQNMHFEDEGAYTGEISASMLRALNCKYIILGHSERRQYFAETDEIINLKIKKAIENKLIPIICVGEFLEQRQNNIQNEVVNRQLTKCLEEIEEEDLKDVIIAYEPVWAIGTGKTATPDQANYMHIAIRETIESLYNKDISEKARVIYGGSVNEDNSGDLFNQSDIDGGLIGGASLTADKFMKIVNSAIF